jgi:hypothetical protein
MEPALTMAWNPCSASRGMSAHHPLETALTIPWNTHAQRQSRVQHVTEIQDFAVQFTQFHHQRRTSNQLEIRWSFPNYF